MASGDGFDGLWRNMRSTDALAAALSATAMRTIAREFFELFLLGELEDEVDDFSSSDERGGGTLPLDLLPLPLLLLLWLLVGKVGEAAGGVIFWVGGMVDSEEYSRDN